MTDKQKLAEFLEKLQALCTEYGASISGCGCCDSPCIEIGTLNLSTVCVNQLDPRGTRRHSILDDRETNRSELYLHDYIAELRS